jgi:hypothetical protein
MKTLLTLAALAMKTPKKQSAPEPKPLVAHFEATAKEWVVETAPGRFRIFMAQDDAERFCAKESRKRTKFTGYHQELPYSSVWTGAPWDRSFEHLR